MNTKFIFIITFLAAHTAILSMNNDVTYDLSAVPPMESQYAQKLLHWAQNNKNDAFNECIQNQETPFGKSIRYEVLQCYWGNNAPEHYDKIPSNIKAYKYTFADLNKKLLETTSLRPGRVNFIKLLLIHGADVNTYAEQDKYKYRPLIRAISNNDTTMVKLLLSHPQIDPNVMAYKSPLIMFALHQEKGTQMVQLLLQTGKININDSDYRGWTILHSAAANGNIEIVKQLLEHPDINPNALTTDTGDAAISLAWWNKETATVDLLQPRTDFSLTPQYNDMRNMGMLAVAIGCILFVLNR